jgi:Protein of unknown function (DUF2628)
MARERLKSFSVHEAPHPAADRIDRAEALEFVPDGFLKKAFLLPPLWLASRGVWVGVLAYAAAAVAILSVAWALMLPTLITLLLFVGLHLIFASECDEMLRSHLTARGWTMIGQVTGTGRLDCERRFYDQWLPTAPVMQPTAPVVMPPPKATTAAQSGFQQPAHLGTSTSILGNLLAPLRRPRDKA